MNNQLTYKGIHYVRINRSTIQSS
ncbi:hypothetical protein NVP1150O_001, partial [Vibrio phage 1.150.O._10N.222.46.A6]